MGWALAGWYPSVHSEDYPRTLGAKPGVSAGIAEHMVRTYTALQGCSDPEQLYRG